ncbi:MAG: nucleotidyltransferase domain-containing protein, partial [Desulfobacterales bacterium]|nr:nucleotidyltransferase domain-containing protein [Desulfobacterales bacterium]
SKIVRPSEKERALARLSKRYRLSAFYACGSRAKEAADIIRTGSGKLVESGNDVDIAVLPDANVVLSAREKVEITLEIEELLGAARVDLVILPEADPFVAVNAIRGERVYCSDEHRADEYELYLLRRAGDLIPLERDRIRMILKVTE